MKKNNKGFSLVELIVVILIMAILGVALTPQIMKWVNNSRISSDITNYDLLVESATVALTKESVYKDVKAMTGTNKITITMSNTGTTVTATVDGDETSFTTELAKVLPNYSGIKRKAEHADYTITIANDAVVTKGSSQPASSLEE